LSKMSCQPKVTIRFSTVLKRHLLHTRFTGQSLPVMDLTTLHLTRTPRGVKFY